ncbi:MAG TPA: hypothetical protein VG167_02165 [Verrucomicrobiae bacterium]|nr:hypothetical protein [Verrucomicrobiae bacterium]
MVASLQAGPADHWHWRSPAPFADRMLSVAFGAGKFVAVGDDGVVHLSADGSAWDEGSRPINETLFQVTYANNQFVAVGAAGAIVTSPDGFTWTRRTSAITNTLLAVTYGNGKYLACGEAGQIALSVDGVTWSMGYAGTDDLPSAAAGNGVFVIPVPGSQSGNVKVLVSNDGVVWTPTTMFTLSPGSPDPAVVYADVFSNGRFVALVESALSLGGVSYIPQKQFYTSTDGTTWVQGAAASGGYANMVPTFLSTANGNVWAGIGASIVSTTDGSTATATSLADAGDANGLAYGHGTYVISGNSGKVLTSTDGMNWTAAYTTNGTSIRQLALGANGYYAVSSNPNTYGYNNTTVHYPGPIFTSLNGLAFRPSSNAPFLPYTGIAFDGSNYVAVAEQGVLYTSTNGVNWTQRTSNASQHLLAVARGATRWVAVGAAGTIVTSPSGTAWTLRFSGTGNDLRGVTYGNGLYVAVGVGGDILTSPDGAIWDVQSSETVADLNSVQYLNGQFFAVGANGTILSSADGMTWTPEISGVSRSLIGIAFGNGLYVAAGSDSVLTSGPDPRQWGTVFGYSPTVLLESTNGMDWRDISTSLPVSVNLRSLAFLGGSFWLTGDNGTILQSDTADGRPVLAGAMLAGNSGFKLDVVLNAPDSYVIQSSAMPGSGWQDVLSVTNPVINHSWIDTNTPGAPVRFYRVKGN